LQGGTDVPDGEVLEVERVAPAALEAIGIDSAGPRDRLLGVARGSTSPSA
jgi:hypothetical protein